MNTICSHCNGTRDIEHSRNKTSTLSVSVSVSLIQSLCLFLPLSLFLSICLFFCLSSPSVVCEKLFSAGDWTKTSSMVGNHSTTDIIIFSDFFLVFSLIQGLMKMTRLILSSTVYPRISFNSHSTWISLPRSWLQYWMTEKLKIFLDLPKISNNAKQAIYELGFNMSFNFPTHLSLDKINSKQYRISVYAH